MDGSVLFRYFVGGLVVSVCLCVVAGDVCWDCVGDCCGLMQ